jgi:hypothetical protein
MVGFIGEDALLGALATWAFLSTDSLQSRALGRRTAFSGTFDFVEQKPPRDETIEPLLTRGLAFDLKPGRAMHEHDARGSLIDILAAVTAGADKRFFDVGFAHAERGHALS